MSPRDLKRQVGAVALAWLTFAQAAVAADLPRLVVLPYGQAEGAPERSGARFSTLVADELKTREDDVHLVISGGKAASPASPAKPAKASPDATAALENGKRALSELKFEEAVALLKKGLELALADPASADFSAIKDAQISLAVAYFRMGEEKGAQAALFTTARLDPNYKLPEGKFPPVFAREFDKAKKRADKASRGSISVEGPPGSNAFVDGRDMGMVPIVEQNLPVGTHYVKVEGSRGESFGQVVELKGGVAKVRASFGGGSGGAATAVAVAEPRIGPVLDADTAAKVAAYVRATGAEYALVGIIYRLNEHQVTAASALYSARRQGFGLLPAYALDQEMLTANVEAFKLADEVTGKMEGFGAPVALPYTLVVEKPKVKVAAAKVRPVEDDPVDTGRRVALKPGEGGTEQIRAFARPSVMEGEGGEGSGERAPTGPVVKSGGLPAWVWVGLSLGVAAAAGGTYYGISEASRPVTGRVTASWNQ